MLGIGFLIALIYFTGKKFFELAHEYRKNCWLYAILGVASYFVISFVLGLILGVILLITNDQTFLLENETAISLIGIPVSIAGVWLFYILLEKNWKKSVSNNKSNIEILDEF